MKYVALYYHSTRELAWTGAAMSVVDLVDDFEAETGRSIDDVSWKNITKDKFDELNDE